MPGMYVDQQPSAQAGNTDRGRQMIDGRGSEDGEPDRQKAGCFLQTQPAECAVELDRFQEAKSISGEEGEFLETICWTDTIQGRA